MSEILNKKENQMSISPQAGGTFSSAFMAQSERYYAAGFATKNLAHIWELSAKEEIKQGFAVTYPKGTVSPSKGVDVSISLWLDKTYRMFWEGTASASQSRHKMKEINAYFGAKTDVNDLSTVLIDEFIHHLKRDNNANSTINRKLATISKMLNYADECIQLRHKPKIHRQKEPQGRMRFVSPEEELQIMHTLDQWSQIDLKDSITVLLDTGIRRSELGRIEEVDIQPDVINLWRTKNELDRSVPMTERVKEIMARRTVKANSVSTRSSKLFPQNMETLSKHWNRVRFHLGYDDMVLHTFRHTTASRLIQRGVSVGVVQEWMGHRTISVTMRYAHLSPKNLLDAVAVLE